MKISVEKRIIQIIVYLSAIIFFSSIIWYIFSGVNDNTDNILNNNNNFTNDEYTYQNIINNFSLNHIRDLYNTGMETKPITFLGLLYVFNANPNYTRALNLILIIINIYLIYKITNNKFSILYVLFPIFLDSLWLVDENIEILCVLLGMCYINKKGILIGIATIFRPYAILYSVFLQKKDIVDVIKIGLLFSGILLGLGLFFPYLYEVTSYSSNKDITTINIFAIFTLFFLFIMGSRNKEMLGYAIIACIPLSIRMFGHYFLPIYTFLFIGFLLTMNEDFKE